MNPFDEFEVFETSFDLDYDKWRKTNISSEITEEDGIYIQDMISDNGLDIEIDETIRNCLKNIIDEYMFKINKCKLIIKGIKNSSNKLHGNMSIYLSYNDNEYLLKHDIKTPMLIIKTNSINGILDGEFILYNSVGISYKCKYNNGKKHGKEYIYNLYASIAINNYYYGLKHGQQIILSRINETPVSNIQSPISGLIIPTAIPPCLEVLSIRLIEHYYFNKRTDYSISYYPSGYIKSINHYYNDKFDGECITYEDLQKTIDSNQNTDEIKNPLIIYYPKVLDYKRFRNNFPIDTPQNKTNGKFDKEGFGATFQYPEHEDLGYADRYYALYDKYKNIKIDVDY